MPEDYYLKDTTISIRIIVDHNSLMPKFLGFRSSEFGMLSEREINNIQYNINKPDSIWSITNLPEYFRSKAGVPEDIEAKLVIPKGKYIPDWKFKTSDNSVFKPNKEQDFSLLVFFSRKCGACVWEIPALNKLNKYKNLKVTGVYFDEDISKLNDFIEKHNIKYEVVLNADAELKELFTNGGFPVNYLIDKNGKIIYSVLGNRPGFEEKITALTRNEN